MTTIKVVPLPPGGIQEATRYDDASLDQLLFPNTHEGCTKMRRDVAVLREAGSECKSLIRSRGEDPVPSSAISCIPASRRRSLHGTSLADSKGLGSR